MKFRKTWMAFAALLLMSSGAWAQAKKSTASAKAPAKTAPAVSQAVPSGKTDGLHQASGKVVSANATLLVLSHLENGKALELQFTMNPETQKEGEMAPGSQVVVRYRAENGTNTAASVKAAAATASHSHAKKAKAT